MDEAGEFDAFVCHASEDKARFVDPLVVALAGCGVRVWYDRLQIAPGDNIAAKINAGLAGSLYGVVVLSPRFWTYWTGEETAALHALESLDRDRPRRIVPVWCEVELADIAAKSPLLAGRLGVHWGLGVDGVARAIARAVGREGAAPVPLPASMGRARVYNRPARPPTRTFVGREHDLATVDRLLVPGGRVGVAASIEGLAGVGKTELALQVVERVAMTDRFPGGIFWLNAEDRDLARQWGGAIADELAIGPGPVDERVRAVMRVVESGGPALVVLDNVVAWTAAAAPTPMPGGPRVAVLATTRARDLAGASFEHVTLEVLAPEAARELLLALIGAKRAGEDGLEALLAHLGGHALAIELAGAFLRAYPGVGAVAYLARLRAGERVEDKVAPQTRYEKTVKAALDATCERLDPVGQAALRVAGCFADEAASLALLRLCGVDEDAERALRDVHLIAGDGASWTMHRLVRAHARAAGGAAAQAAAQRAFVDGCVARGHEIELATGYAIYRADGTHLGRAIEELGTELDRDPGHASLLMDRLGTGAQSSGDLPRARDLLEHALAAARRRFGDDHPDVSTRENNVALVLQALGDLPRARVLLEHALAADRRRFGDDHPDVATSEANLATLLWQAGERDAARAEIRRALAIARNQPLGSRVRVGVEKTARQMGLDVPDE